MDKSTFPIFKGLQKPLEFMGIRGRFLMMAAMCIGASFIGFIVFSIFLGSMAGFGAMFIIIAASLITIYIKQKGGLHNKRRDHGIYIYRDIIKK